MSHDVLDVLYELGCEELPSGAVSLLGNALAEHTTQWLLKAKFTHGDVVSYATPRRLAVFIRSVQVEQDAQSIVRRGPSTSLAINTPAVMGFARACGVGVEQLTTMTTDKGSWWTYAFEQPGMHLRDALPMMLHEVIQSLPIAKPMRWGVGDSSFVRPIHWVVLLLGNEVVSTDVLGVRTGRYSIGHRYHHPDLVLISEPSLYADALRKAFVIVDFNERRQVVMTQIEQLLAEQDSVAIMPSDLVDEVTSIVEWPHALMIEFDPAFLDVPAEALITAMQSHQKCFAVRHKQGHLLPQFITVSNIVSQQPQRVINGNQSVMRARLSDASFFFHLDKKKPLIDYYSATSHVVFQQKLGSLADKSERLRCIMRELSSCLSLDAAQADRVALLSKCDLMTGMVGEFPELQGLMGYYYAKNDGESEAVAIALNEQYMPRFAADQLPASKLGCALSLADRLDTLVGAFAIGQKPTGDKDPFKLRRHALAVVRLLMMLSDSLQLTSLMDVARRAHGFALDDVLPHMNELRLFVLDRLPSFYQSQTIALDVVDAVRVVEDNHLFDLDKRVRALVLFMHQPEAAALSAACKRVDHLLLQVPAQERLELHDMEYHSSMEPTETALFERLQTLETIVAALNQTQDYGLILTELASLREPLDLFFNGVMVMTDDLAVRRHRLSLLARVQRLLKTVADISLLRM